MANFSYSHGETFPTQRVKYMMKDNVFPFPFCSWFSQATMAPQDKKKARHLEMGHLPHAIHPALIMYCTSRLSCAGRGLAVALLRQYSQNSLDRIRRLSLSIAQETEANYS